MYVMSCNVTLRYVSYGMVCMYCAGQGRLFEVEELVGGDAG